MRIQEKCASFPRSTSSKIHFQYGNLTNYCIFIMYTKQELEKLSIPELMVIASELGIKVNQDDELETVIYAILDKAAENSAAGVSTPKRKRTRIAKDNSKVYTVNGAEAETLDAKATKAKKKPTLDALFAEQDAQQAAKDAAKEAESAEPAEAEKPAPKKRGRKSKKELEEIAAQEAAAKEAEIAFSETAQDTAEVPEAVAQDTNTGVDEHTADDVRHLL